MCFPLHFRPGILTTACETHAKPCLTRQTNKEQMLLISHKHSGVLDLLIKHGKRSKQSMTRTFLNISLRVSINFPVWRSGSKKSVKSRYQTNIKDEVFIYWSNLHLMGLFLWLWWWKNKRAKCNRWACHLFTHEAWWITSI